jgi:hypothetical protein
MLSERIWNGLCCRAPSAKTIVPPGESQESVVHLCPEADRSLGGQLGPGSIARPSLTLLFRKVFLSCGIVMGLLCLYFFIRPRAGPDHLVPLYPIMRTASIAPVPDPG